MKSKVQAGFTLVELIVVIVILGILAAVAVPRFMGLETEARIASLKTMGGTMMSAANMAHGVCMARGCANNSTITIAGQAVTFRFGYPNNVSIQRLLQNTQGFTGANNRLTKSGANTANCWVEYRMPAVAGQPPTIAYQAGVITDSGSETLVNNALAGQC
jgi:MSHA pilin protein MshA